VLDSCEILSSKVVSSRAEDPEGCKVFEIKDWRLCMKYENYEITKIIVE